MSLNGLDEAQVKEAYDAATGEPGGWCVSHLISSPFFSFS